MERRERHYSNKVGGHSLRSFYNKARHAANKCGLHFSKGEIVPNCEFTHIQKRAMKRIPQK